MLVARRDERAARAKLVAGIGLLHLHPQISFRCFAKERVKSSGMCCTIATPQVEAGKALRISRSASVPPVDAPIAITFAAAPPATAGRRVTRGLARTESPPRDGAARARPHGRRRSTARRILRERPGTPHAASR